MGFLRTYGGVKRKLGGMFSRGAMRAATKLGRIRVPMPEGAKEKFRNPALNMLDAYYEGTQYDHLLEWDEVNDAQGGHIPVRQRKPRIVFHFPKVLCQRITSKLVGETTFPSFEVEADPDTTEYLKYIIIIYIIILIYQGGVINYGRKSSKSWSIKRRRLSVFC